MILDDVCDKNHVVVRVASSNSFACQLRHSIHAMMTSDSFLETRLAE